jgi:hypothetical protein
MEDYYALLDGYVDYAAEANATAAPTGGGYTSVSATKAATTGAPVYLNPAPTFQDYPNNGWSWGSGAAPGPSTAAAGAGSATTLQHVNAWVPGMPLTFPAEYPPVAAYPVAAYPVAAYPCTCRTHSVSEVRSDQAVASSGGSGSNDTARGKHAPDKPLTNPKPPKKLKVTEAEAIRCPKRHCPEVFRDAESLLEHLRCTPHLNSVWMCLCCETRFEEWYNMYLHVFKQKECRRFHKRQHIF